jgi:hypothetical protein
MEFFTYRAAGGLLNGSRPVINGSLTNYAKVACLVNTQTSFPKTKQWIMGQLGLGDRNHRGYYCNVFGTLKANGIIKYDKERREWVPDYRATEYMTYIKDYVK